MIHEFIEQSEAILKDNLIGIYLHGSSVMGCFNPQKSDVDLIVVVDRPLSDAVKRAYMDMVVRLNASGPAKGIEMSIVRKSVCRPFLYPTPFELHFSVGHLAWYTKDPDDYIREMKGTDPDLAAHFTVINRRGKSLYGAPIREIFGEVPGEDYMDSIWKDIEEATEKIGEDTMYLTLNLARVLAYQEESLVLSKKEGGEWALGRLPSLYHSLIEDALKEYVESAAIDYDKALARRYAEYVIQLLREKRKQ